MSKLIYKNPAKKWKEALPLGNGKIAAMVYGGKNREKISFNDSTLWSGYPKDKTNVDSEKNLQAVRQLIFEEKNHEADQLAKKSLCGGYSEAYMPLGDLSIDFKGLNLQKKYKRCLDLEKAILEIDDGVYERESFISFIDKVFCYAIKSKKERTYTFKLKSKLKYEILVSNDKIFMYGYAPDFAAPNYIIKEMRPIRYNEKRAMSFCLGLKICTDGIIESKNKKITVKKAKNTVFYAVTESGFNGYDKMPSRDVNLLIERCKKSLNGINKEYSKIKIDHAKDFTNLIRKQTFNIEGVEADVSKLLDNAKKGKVENSLVKLFYDFGKYLTVSGSRIQPLNLQGQWNKSIRPPWSSNLTTNINFEMNYWGTVNCNLKECIKPFYHCIDEIVESGKITAKINYGTKGFACNHNVDIWRKTTPVCGNPAYMFSPLCGVWLANEYYQHKKDEDEIDINTLKIIEEAVAFCIDFLIEQNGYLVTCPSASPEAEFYKDKKPCALDYSSAFDIGIIRQCFDNALNLEISKELKSKINLMISKLYPFTESVEGVNEWHNEKEIIDKGHRHFSPLYALYPGKIIKFYSNKKEIESFRKLFFYRLNHARNSIGWSAAWAMCLAARLHDSETATKLLDGMLKKSVFTNLFAYHPPTYFQIDGNLGFVAAVNEMLVYEENDILDLLPAVHKQWKNGSMKGYLINGITINFKWNNFKVTEISSDKLIKISPSNLSDNIKLTNVKVVERMY